MDISLTPLETRIIGCLIEKQITTPDQYPLSLNSLTAACNQKSNRDPLLNLAEREVQFGLDGLARRHFVIERSGFGSRVPKYQHRFCNTEYGTLKLSDQEVAVLCELMLRGPQTPGELRARANRLAMIAEVADVEATLHSLLNRADGPFVARLPREPGRRDSRYAHRFGEHAAAVNAPEMATESGHPTVATPAVPGQAASRQDLEARLVEIEARVAALEQRGS